MSEEVDALNLPQDPTLTIYSRWQHTNGNQYIILCVANCHTEDPKRYPPTVVYQGDNGRIWSRDASDWHRSMKRMPE
jgi:hypothetical protein